MSSNIFLARSSPEDFDRTVLSEVELSSYPDHPEAFSEMDTVRFFGAPESKKDTFEKMSTDDLVLFHQNGEYVGTGWIGITFEDEQQWAGTKVWSDTSSTLIYTVQGVKPVSVPTTAVNRIFGYADGYTPLNLMRVAGSRVDSRPKAIKRALEQYTEKHS
ncbi:hypothetical protein KM295_16210 [Natronomonas sp. F2-12]|uniref:Uncharacterized protein n=1 Tax=Natronomonas aquatica TaxID=2841590 RepID=A0A9R1CWX7_9EURY|nr:hypothetical protein [Natronomonas aquatica]MCQ4334996.1 hypothetical protein [Natronomonas aquatica]